MTDNSESANPLFVASLEKGMSVLSVLAESGRPLSLADISRLTGMGRSAAQRFAFTLKSLGYLVQDPANKHYMLSARMLQFGEAYSNRDTIQQIAYSVLEDVNRECEETINLTVLDGAGVVYVLRFQSRHVVSVNLKVGSRLPAYCTAPGRAILAWLPPEEAKRILTGSRRKKQTANTETDPKRLMEILASVRERGYSLNNQEAFVGDISIAAPVRDRKGHPVAAVNIAVPSPRWEVDRVEAELGPVVVQAAARISELLGWRHGAA